MTTTTTRAVLACLGILVCGCSRAGQPPGEDSAVDTGKAFTLVAAGDVVHPQHTGYSAEFKRLGDAMFRPTRFLPQSADLAFVSLASAISPRKPTSPNKITFTTSDVTLDALLVSHFNLINIGHNHIMDAGLDGLADTLNALALRKRGLQPGQILEWAGAGRTPEEMKQPALFLVPGKEISAAFFSYGNIPDRHVNRFDVERARSEIAALRATGNADFIIVSVRCGREYVHYPEPRTVRELRSLVDAGADVILAHQAHVPQGIEFHKGKPIFYSLGNYLMGTVTYRNGSARLYGYIPRVSFRRIGNSIVTEKIEVFPTYNDNRTPLVVGGRRLPQRRFVTEILQGAFADEVLKGIVRWSRALPGNLAHLDIKEGKLIITPP